MADKWMIVVAALAVIGSVVMGAMYYGLRMDIEHRDTTTAESAGQFDVVMKELREQLNLSQEKIETLREQVQQSPEANGHLDLQMKIEELKSDALTLLREKNELLTNNSSLKAEQASAHRKYETLQAQLQEAQADLKSAPPSADRDRLQSENQEIKEQLAQLEIVGARQANRIRELNYEVDSLQSNISKLETQVQQGGSALSTPPDRIPPANDVTTSTDTNPPIDDTVPTDSVPPTDQADQSLEIIEVNSDFAVVDKGSDHGIEAGMLLYVFRGSLLVGMLEVLSADPEMSTTEVLRGSNGEDVVLLKTDTVRTVNVATD